ncbi:glucanosyltransferase GAS5 [Seminavis robusta]|uniref:Glucanosyltransferase GAS5 n=1 Tax=Seminavis robusta TaxID=568900 RepID=A0A9N8ENZ0_9STRA|nr:glucanosyltransferase GAS5 [Seminavis robusta]|eukprot:Sro1557_g282290.1 glucanosyltransferase GAS5 (481) ;mRNA; f:25052-26663
MKLSTLAALFLLHLSSVRGQTCEDFAPPAEIHGRKFFSSYSGDYLAIKGISYYPRPNEGDLTVTNSIDFFTEEYRSIWERDIEEFKDLGVNAIRIYAVDPGKNHDGFMCALKAAGIYVIVGLAAECFNCAITSDAPPLCYPAELKRRGEFIIQQFAKYENVLAFSAGNEVSLHRTSHSTENAPCQKKFIRDMRAYVQRCSDSMRKIPIGVIKADVERENKALYYNCRSDPDDELENADFIGINSYLHCDGAATGIDELVGYSKLLEDYESFGMTVPVLWTEFGCLNESFEEVEGYETQRNFLQVEALYSKTYREEFAGGFVFEYSTEKSMAQDESPYPFDTFGPDNWGVGHFEPENCDDVTTPCEYERFPEWYNLAEKYAAVDTSDEPNKLFYEREWNDPVPPTCPDEFPPLDSFAWPSELVPQLPQECPVEMPVFCAGVPLECNVVTLPPVSSAPVSCRWIVTLTLGTAIGQALLALLV